MPKEISIRIPKPCDKSWSNFRPTPGGGFCSNCQKEVIDFTSWQEKDLYHFLQKNQQPGCGRFRPEQLRSYAASEVPTGSGYKSYFFGLLGLLALFSARETEAQSMPPDTVQHEGQAIRRAKAPVASQKSPTKKEFFIEGTVFDETSREGIPGVSVALKGTQINVYTDLDGNFRLPVSGEVNAKVVLTIRFIGYLTEEKEILLKEKNMNLGKIPLLEDVHVLGDLVVARKWSPRWIWWQIRSIF